MAKNDWKKYFLRFLSAQKLLKITDWLVLQPIRNLSQSFPENWRSFSQWNFLLKKENLFAPSWIDLQKNEGVEERDKK
jgi:hypothetical protein